MSQASSYEVNQVYNAVANVANAISHIQSDVGEVRGHVEHLDSQQRSIADELAQLAAQFQAFVDADAQSKQLQLAETRLVKLRQDVESTFGHHREVRRRATGILQALDAGLVTHDTIQHTTEDVMMSTPGYWLSPALVSLAGWIRDDKDLASQAMKEALRRDDARTALFFGLVLRRYQRETASIRWITRYFERQDPMNLPRETMVVLDAVTNGGFGPAAREMSIHSLERWVELLSAQSGFVEQQHDRWVNSLRGLQLSPPDFPYLSQYSPDHGQLHTVMARSGLHARVRDYFSQVYEGEVPMSPHLSEQVDAILESLVTNYDNEELPLRKQERELELIVQTNGDQALARARFESEVEAFDSSISFAALLTNAAMHAQQSGASLATQRFAIAMSREWIKGAYDQLVAEARQGVPSKIRLNIDDWHCETDGDDEEQLVGRQQSEYEERADRASDAVTHEPAFYLSAAIGAAGVLIGLFMWVNLFFLFVGFGALGYAYIQFNQLDERKAQARTQVEEQHRQAQKILRACIAEFVDWKHQWAERDGEAAGAKETLASIVARDHMKMHGSDGRSVMTP